MNTIRLHGLPATEITNIQLPDYLVNRPADTHKGHYGHALLIAGSYGKMGAAILAARACLRSGVGLLTVHVPQCGVDIMQTAVPEAMVDIDNHPHYFSSLPIDITKYDAIAIGPGLGTSTETQTALHNLLLHRGSTPMVIDADGLNIIAQHPEWMTLIQNSIITPHAIEFARLFGTFASDTERLKSQRGYAIQLNCDILYKGHRSIIADRQGNMYINTTGNPGMATAGSGDVLTGITLALCAQHIGFQKHEIHHTNPPELVIATYLHGKSGDIAAQKQGIASITAQDIIDNLRFAIH